MSSRRLAAAARRLSAKDFRLHTLEGTLTGLVMALLALLPWALLGMRFWAQQIAFGLATTAFIVARIPRTTTTATTPTAPCVFTPTRGCFGFQSNGWDFTSAGGRSREDPDGGRDGGTDGEGSQAG